MEEHEESSESLAPIYTKDGQWKSTRANIVAQRSIALIPSPTTYKETPYSTLETLLTQSTLITQATAGKQGTYTAENMVQLSIMSTSQQYQMSVEANPALHADRPGLPSESLIADAHTRLSLIFNSFVGQHRVSGSQGTNGLALVLYCPLEGGEYVIDATVHELAQRSGATVTTIDLAQLINEQPRSFWEDASKSSQDKESNSDSKSKPESANDTGYFKMHEPITSNRICDLVDMAIREPSGDPTVGDTSEKHRRIVYVRDFGFLATFAPECYKRIVKDSQDQVDGDTGSTELGKTSITVILGASPLLVKDGLFQKSDPRTLTRRDSSPDLMSLLTSRRSKPETKPESETPGSWGEGEDADKAREERLRRQHEMWNSNTLSSHIHDHLTKVGVSAEKGRGRSSRSKCIPACIVVPKKRNLEQERFSREKRRLKLNELQVRMALLASGGELESLTDVVESRFKEQLIECDVIQQVADRALSFALSLPSNSSSSAHPTISWEAYCDAWKRQEERDRERAQWMESSVLMENKSSDDSNEDDGESSSSSSDSSSNSGDYIPTSNRSKDKKDTTDPVVERVKNEGMDSYERQMLDCLIRPDDLQSGFDAVHLPDSTIETIRTVVSLQLVCPEAFQTGILKQYNMSGALLFGPPGTGKTLLAKAIAKESGARMLSVKPSDILERCVGEEEKKVQALFKLARRLKPCVIFIDEVDALFGARMSARNDNSSRWRTDMLTQFTQEMDGMLSSDVIVIGATNRPFDLDDAIIRRLPCRILVDLPDTNARQAILKILLLNENLGSDVNLAELASQTPHFSGSDLKHLCVMAAFESAKELAKISWIDEKGKKGKKPGSAVSALGNLSPATSESGIEEVDAPIASTAATANDAESRLADVPQTRTISKRHLAHALGQVRASTSEMQSSLTELRRWNEQFGSGSRSSRTNGVAVPGPALSGPGQTWINGTGINTHGMGTSVMDGPGTYGSGAYGSGSYGSEMRVHGMNGSTGHVVDVNYVPPPRGTYLRSLGIDLDAK
ncbi:AAA protein [Rhizoctonia solani]|uniref:AAA protein n=1 Tax=Rhizoctonia solani TaxID=456999 RepID=A0A8H7H736_9AGAM|nr:AAA protein [Rhizoctonia solani]